MNSVGSRLVSPLFVATVLFAAPPAAGQGPCGEPTNLTVNCSFTGNINSWVQIYGVAFAHSSDGNISAGSLEATADNSSQGLRIIQCVDQVAAAATTFGAGAWIKVVSGTPGYCTVLVTEYSPASCASGILRDSYHYIFLDDNDTDWTWIGFEFVPDSGATSMLIDVSCYESGGGLFVVRVDDIYLGASLEPPLFFDGFETGDTTKWSTAVP